MITVALITDTTNCPAAQWQFDKVLAAIAYDCEMYIIFIHNGKQQLLTNNAWKCLDLYGVEEVFYLADETAPIEKSIFKVREINTKQLKKLLNRSDIII
ncbi:MAG: hypothetical protein JKY19_12065 [Alcanivoracaceae bacterium]|nr:hypothetical protein [Alcanivoracaceae bacterium]